MEEVSSRASMASEGGGENPPPLGGVRGGAEVSEDSLLITEIKI